MNKDGKTVKKDLREIRLSTIEDLPATFMIETDKNRKWYFFWNYIPIIDRYIFKEIIYPFLVSLSFFILVFLFVYLQKIVSLLFSKGIPFLQILNYFGYLISSILPDTIPMACLMSGLMATGRLSNDSELTALSASGLSFKRISRVFLFFGLIIAFFVGFLNFYLIPRNNLKMEEFNKWILSYNPLLFVKSGQFTEDRSNQISNQSAQTLYVDSIDKQGEMQDIQIREWKVFLDDTNKNEYMNFNGSLIPIGGSNISQIIFAKNGKISEKLNQDGKYESLVQLQNGFLLKWEIDGSFSFTNFMTGKMDYKVQSKKKISPNLEINLNPANYSLPKLFEIKRILMYENFEKLPGLEKLKDMDYSIQGIQGLKFMVKKMQLELLLKNDSMTLDEMTQQYMIFTQFERLLQEAKKTLTDFNIEIHRRISLPLSCQFFFLLSFPLGFVSKRSGRSSNFVLAILFLLIYYFFFIFGSNISYKEKIPDWIGPWSANIVITCISIYVIITRTDVKFPRYISRMIELIHKMIQFRKFFKK